jgi:hypothetical protein
MSSVCRAGRLPHDLNIFQSALGIIIFAVFSVFRVFRPGFPPLFANTLGVPTCSEVFLTPG